MSRVDGVNAVELTKKIRSHAASAPPPALPAAPKVESCLEYLALFLPQNWCECQHHNYTLSPGGLGHKVETIDQCSQVHAFYEGVLNLSQYLSSEDCL